MPASFASRRAADQGRQDNAGTVMISSESKLKLPFILRLLTIRMAGRRYKIFRYDLNFQKIRVIIVRGL
jgi:hypothetical protein